MTYAWRQFAVVAIVGLLICPGLSAVVAQETGELVIELDANTQVSREVSTERLLVVKISERLLTDLLRKPIREHNRVNTTIIGTPVQGNSFTYGRIYFDCVESHDQARFWLLFAGQTTANTVGHQYPAYVHSTTLTKFVAGKEITYNTADELDIKPARIISDSDRCTREIATPYPGLRGAIVRKVAAKKLAQQSGAIAHEASQKAEAQIKESFDRQVRERLGSFRERLSRISPRLERETDRRGYVWNIGTDHQYLIIAGSERPTDGSPVSRSLANLSLPEPPRDDALIEIWQHNRFDLTDAQSIQQSFQVLRSVLQVLSNSDQVPAEYRTNFKMITEFDSEVSQHQQWNVFQLYRE